MAKTHCNRCGHPLPAELIEKNRPTCRSCAVLYTREYRQRNPHKRKEHYLRNKERVLAQAAQYRSNHKEQEKAARRAHYERNKEHVAKTTKTYREANPALYAEAFARRRAITRNAFVKWADRAKIKEIYKHARYLTDATGLIWEVDHVYPLQGKTVCGLHVETNLKIVLREDNRSKGNKLPGFE